ncbi:hypothetical protein EV424DRAFT_1355830 [Suillus variegatus]|nr:hypothetical protein EV424DRAFT_1355830 [Suillus variegatus]
MTPEAANDALNTTLATLQSLIKCCIHLNQDDQEALKLSDEIARRVPLCDNTPRMAPFKLCPTGTLWSTMTHASRATHASTRRWTTVLSLQLELFPHWRFKLPGRHLSSGLLTVPAAVGPFMKQAPAVEVDSTPLSPLPAYLELEPLTPLAPSVASATPSTTRHKLFVPGNISKKVKVTPHPRNDKKRKAEEDDTDSADAPRCPTGSLKPNLKKIKKLPSHDGQNKLRKTRNGTTKAGLLTVAHTSPMHLVADIGQGSIAVRQDLKIYWTWKLRMPSTRPLIIVSGTQKLGLVIGVWIQQLLQQWSIPFATIHENVTNARNQASLALSYQTKRLDAHDSFAQIATGQSEMLKKDSPAPLTMPAVPLSTPAVKEITEHGDVEEQPINSTVTPAEVMLFSPIAKPGQTSQVEQVHPMGVDHLVEEADQPMGVDHPAEQEPTAKDILQAIWDLGNKFDLLATNERVDALDAKVNSVEEVFGHWLTTLERLIKSSNAQWKAMSSTQPLSFQCGSMAPGALMMWASLWSADSGRMHGTHL